MYELQDRGLMFQSFKVFKVSKIPPPGFIFTFAGRLEAFSRETFETLETLTQPLNLFQPPC
jgi:hypothetical protein